MSSISSATGLISGLPIQDLVDSLIAIQRRPVTLMQNRIAQLTQRRTALLGVSAQILAIRNAAARLGDSAAFRATLASSSNEQSVLATASAGAAVGQYTFSVRGLATTHQLISSGFATRNATPIGAGVLTIESAAGRLNRSTPLAGLNGGDGVRAGKIRITDRAGASAEIDLTSATTIADVVAAINGQVAANVVARVDGDRLFVEDRTGLTTGTLSVAEVGGGRTADDLGIAGSSAAGVITGRNLVRLSGDTRLDLLNDGNGVRRLAIGADFRIALADGTEFDVGLAERIATDTPLAALNHGAGVPGGTIRVYNRAGAGANGYIDIDLSAARTIGDVKTAIESAGADLTVNLTARGLSIVDNSTGSNTTRIEEVAGGTTAQALGIAGSTTTGTLTGGDVYFVQTIGDVIRVINHHAGNNGKLVAAVAADGLGLTLTDTTTGAGTFEVTALGGSNAADDLGILAPSAGGVIASRRLLAGLDTVLLRSLNGGGGVELGTIELTDRAGTTASVDLTGARTLADVIAAINSAATSITAAVSSSGLGIVLTDESGGTGNLRIVDVTGTAAAGLKIAFEGASSTVASGNLQRQYVSAATRLATLNAGAGVPAGKFRITDSSGAAAVVDLTQGNEVTLQDVIDEINSRGIGVVATINATGDGLLLTDTAGGSGRLRVEEDGGTTAAALGILGEAATGATTIDGSFETRITVAAADTLEDVLAKIRASRAGVNAAIIQDGSASRPYRLSLTSKLSGRAGESTVEATSGGQPGAAVLQFDTLAEARDAVVLFGSANGGTPLIVTSSSNTLSNVIEGVRLDLVGVSASPVTVSVTQDLESAISDIRAFVAAFNAAISRIDDLTKFDPETEVRGVLQGDSSMTIARRRLTSLINQTAAGLSAPFNRLGGVGVTATTGSQLTFDETKFREAYARDPAAVEALFTTDETGFGALIESVADGLTDQDDGLIARREQALAGTEDVLNDRIVQLQALIERRRARLFAQFQATESALAQLQRQQSALSGLTSILGTTSLV